MIEILKKKSIKWWVGIGSCVILFVFILLFSFIKMRAIVRGVELSVNLEKDVNSSLVQIKGNAKNSVHLTLNG
jgi:hypothetical protein